MHIIKDYGRSRKREEKQMTERMAEAMQMVDEMFKEALRSMEEEKANYRQTHKTGKYAHNQTRLR